MESSAWDIIEIMRHYRKYDEEREARGLEPVMGPRLRELRKELEELEANTKREG